MTNIYEALQQNRPVPAPTDAHLLAPDKGVLKPTPAAMERRMLDLYQGLAARLPKPETGRGAVVEMLAYRAREGASTLARELAKVVALKVTRSVLLLDANQRAPHQLSAFQIEPVGGWEEAVRNPHLGKEVLYQVGDFPLYVGQVSMNPRSVPPVFELPQLGEYFERLRQRFDLVIVDAPPASDSADGLSLVRHVDGVVMVVEAERLRREVAGSLKTRVVEQGGRLLGVVLNKRRHFIPGFLYRRL